MVLFIVVYGLLVILGLVSLVCWIMEIVAAFTKGDGPQLGILSIVLCSLGGFVIGWVKSKEWGIQQVMLIWTSTIFVALLCQIFLWTMGVVTVETMSP